MNLTGEELRAYREGRISAREDGLLVPLTGQYRARIAMWLIAPGRTWPEEELRLLRQVAHLIGIEYERVQGQRHLAVRSLMSGPAG
ncbi:hypothetical protein [Deinococcus alpinitundrae]|uniref:hypothetical protein n=1 Tax=Deinococcus alpinitundrae TaxID=468913 RepID=UPI00137AA179|nr:hypothetical protein [Deinococcus alpinitundrae]